MPCIYDESPEEIEEGRVREILASKEYKKLKKELNLTTRLLCSVCRDMEGMGCIAIQPYQKSELSEWWRKHKQMDARKRKEQNETTTSN